MAPSVPECQDCGLCCFSRLASYVRVDGEDYARLGDAAETATEFVGNRCYMRMHGGHCAALVQNGDRFACSVYERRPAVCRTLERGSPACAAEREQKAQRTLPLLGDARL